MLYREHTFSVPRGRASERIPLERTFRENDPFEQPDANSLENLLNEALDATMFREMPEHHSSQFAAAERIVEVGGGQRRDAKEHVIVSPPASRPRAGSVSAAGRNTGRTRCDAVASNVRIDRPGPSIASGARSAMHRGFRTAEASLKHPATERRGNVALARVFLVLS
jgi:hypothetical protein